MICALPECDLDVPQAKGGRPARFCSQTHARRAQSRRQAALRRGEHLKPGEIPELQGAGISRGDEPTKLSRAAATSRLAEILEENGIPAEEIGAVKSFHINQWTALAKGEMITDEEGKRYREPTRRVGMESVGIVLHPTWATGPRWPVVQPADPIEVRVPATTSRAARGSWKTALLLPDPQFGFRRDIYSGELDPFHDTRALDIALQIAEVERPDLTIWLGDFLDLAPASVKYLQEAGFALTIQPAIDAGYEWLAKFAALSSETRLIEGNHDRRLADLVRSNAMAAFGLRRAAASPEDWPVMSLPHLLRFDELGIEYVGGYPAGATYINSNLAAIHGSKIGTNIRSSASMVVEDERVSVITGHVHRIETRYKTRNTRGAPKFTFAHTPGCLARIDGAVPSVKGGIDAFSRPVKSWEDWTQGLAIVRYQEGDGKFTLESVPIFEGWAMHHGREYRSA